MMEPNDVVKMLEKLSDISERLAKVEVMLSERSRATSDFQDTVYVEYTRASLRPYLVVQAPEHEAIPYTATDVDIFSDDWEVVQ